MQKNERYRRKRQSRMKKSKNDTSLNMKSVYEKHKNNQQNIPTKDMQKMDTRLAPKH